ncbi:MAG: sugar phosphate isomerase/epimerase family protein [Planctomycetota bacterium]|jgi:sugar phosphate isomerase/epimerase
MLLTLSANSLRSLDSADGSGRLSLLDMPAYAISQLELRGLNIPASMLAGWNLQDLDKLRDSADKAGCPCLVLVEDTPLKFGSKRAKIRSDAADRVEKLAVAANRLGCNALAMGIEAKDDDDSFELVADEIRRVMPRVERLELNVLLVPGEGLTADPARLTELIKRIGGFRIGSLPTFGHAATTGDPVEALRKLAPYAGAVHATITGFEKGKHVGFDLDQCIQAIRSVGFVNTVAIEYIGDGDPVATIDQARQVLQAAIDDDGSG